MPATPNIHVEIETSPEQHVAHLATLPEVHHAFDWFRSAESTLRQWQIEMARVPAPPFGEAARGVWLAARFRELGLNDVHIDEVGNVLGIHPGETRTGVAGHYVSVSAHIDTVFPANTPLDIREEGSKLLGPGVSDNGAGLTALLGIAGALQATAIHPRSPVLFIGNVGEEGEGDLRGIRHIFAQPRWLNSISHSVILDGAGTDVIIAEALGSRRFEVTMRGPGGHSWSDFGAPNPIVALARAIETFSRTPIPHHPKSSTNIGVIRGGTSVNSIPESASMRVDIRSASAKEVDRLEAALRSAIELAVESEQEISRNGAGQCPFSAEVATIGNRPAGELPADARILQVIRAVDKHLDNSAQVQRASTDANIPLSLGRQAIALGGGGRGGGAHTLQEWFDCAGRELGLRRILLAVLALTGVHE